VTVTEAVRKARIQADAEVPLDDISPDEFGNLWMQVFDRHMAEFGFTYKGVIWNCDCPCAAYGKHQLDCGYSVMPSEVQP